MDNIMRERSYRKLQNLLIDYSTIITDARDKGNIETRVYYADVESSGYMNVNVPPSLRQINEVFTNFDPHAITDILENVASIMCYEINKRKGLLLLEEALNTQLVNEIYRIKVKHTYGCFYRNKAEITITCGTKLNEAIDRFTPLQNIENDKLWEQENLRKVEIENERMLARERFKRL